MDYNTFCVVDHAAVEQWVKKAHDESQRSGVDCVVCLCPARTNTEYFHNIVLKEASEVRFIKGRLKMQGHAKQSPFPSCVVVFSRHSGSDLQRKSDRRSARILTNA